MFPRTSAAVESSEALLGPLVLLHDLGLLFGGEVVLNVKELTYLLDGLVLDQAGDLGAGELKERLNVKVVGGHDQFEKNFLLQVDVIGVPGVNNAGHIYAFEGLLDLGGLVVLQVLAEVDNLLEDGSLDVGQGNLLIRAVVDETLNKDGFLGDLGVDFDLLTI